MHIIIRHWAAEMLLSIPHQMLRSEIAANRSSNDIPLSLQVISEKLSFMLLFPNDFPFKMRTEEKNSFVVRCQ